jgi:predicted methyltransferase
VGEATGLSATVAFTIAWGVKQPSFASALLLSALLAACGPAPEAQTPPAGSASPGATPSTSPSATPSAAPTAAAFPVPAAIQAVVDAADRSEADRKLDKGRHPGEMLAFFGIAPGMKVAELGAGGGYTAELLMRAVGPTGTVYGQNNKFFLEKFAEKPWSERLAKPVMKGAVRVDREFDDPLPAEAKNLDAVFLVLLYHDTVWLKTDREKMNRAVFAALKPGGVFAIVDHSGRPGTGVSEAQSFHRIDEKVVREEAEKAGFKLVAEGAFLRNPADTRDWNDAPSAAADRRGTSDRFVLKLVKPAG